MPDAGQGWFLISLLVLPSHFSQNLSAPLGDPYHAITGRTCTRCYFAATTVLSLQVKATHTSQVIQCNSLNTNKSCNSTELMSLDIPDSFGLLLISLHILYSHHSHPDPLQILIKVILILCNKVCSQVYAGLLVRWHPGLESN